MSSIDIEGLNNSLPPISVPDLKRESANSKCGRCPKCGGVDRFVYREDLDCFFCRNCHPKMGDRIEFHAWMTGLTSSEFLKGQRVNKDNKTDTKKAEKLSGAELKQIWNQIRSVNTDPKKVYDYLCGQRKISRETVDRALLSGNICGCDYGSRLSTAVLNKFYADGTDPYTVAFQFDRLDTGAISTIEYISATGKPLNLAGKKKLFHSKTLAGEGFFHAGQPIEQADQFFLVEAAINALSGVDRFPDACWLALGGSTMTKKLSQLKKVLHAKRN